MKKLLAALMLICIITVQLLPLSVSASAATSYAGIVATSSSGLNVRSSASQSASIVGSLKKGSYVTLISKTGSWWLVEYRDGKTGYCHSDYIKTVSATQGNVKLSSGYLNVRSGTGTSYSVTDKLYNGEKVYILTDYGTWVRILFDGNEIGYVNENYITTSSRNSTSSYLKLSVPYYSQTDSRWSSVKLGSSGKTLGKIGCTTTCLAMTESYRKGTVVRPDTISYSLSYSSSGSLYWPSNYTTTTSVSYSKIRSLLQEGKPVILGLRTSSYSTHWVVVTGYSGDTYYVNDPGSSSRTTLGSVLEKYPYFYKLAYYI